MKFNSADKNSKYQVGNRKDPNLLYTRLLQKNIFLN